MELCNHFSRRAALLKAVPYALNRRQKESVVLAGAAFSGDALGVCPSVSGAIIRGGCPLAHHVVPRVNLPALALFTSRRARPSQHPVDVPPLHLPPLSVTHG